MNIADRPITNRRQWLLHTMRAAILTALAGLSWVLFGRSRTHRCQQGLCDGCALWTQCKGE